MDWAVILIRSPRLSDRIWIHEDKASAYRRAYALQDLHSCKMDESEVAKTIMIQAGDFYNG